MVWILTIFFIFGKKKDKRLKSSKSEIWFWREFLFAKKHLYTKFQKISSNNLQDNLWRTDWLMNRGDSICPFGLQPGTKNACTYIQSKDILLGWIQVNLPKSSALKLCWKHWYWFDFSFKIGLKVTVSEKKVTLTESFWKTLS